MSQFRKVKARKVTEYHFLVKTVKEKSKEPPQSIILNYN
jgi:hypothetical protein